MWQAAGAEAQAEALARARKEAEDLRGLIALREADIETLERQVDTLRTLAGRLAVCRI